MAKGLSITQVQMYCKMVDEKFRLVSSALIKKNDKTKEDMVVEVQKKLGIYEQMCSIKVMKKAVEELEIEVANAMRNKGLLGKRFYYDVMESVRSAISDLADDKMTDEYKEVHALNDEAEEIQNKIRLAMVGQEVLDIFTNLDKIIAERLAAIEKE